MVQNSSYMCVSLIDDGMRSCVLKASDMEKVLHHWVYKGKEGTYTIDMHFSHSALSLAQYPQYQRAYKRPGLSHDPSSFGTLQRNRS